MEVDYTKIGRVRPVFKGTWSESTAYTVLDTVRSADGCAAYAALKDVPAGTPLTNTSYWQLIVDVTAAVRAANEAASKSARPATAVSTVSPAQIYPEEGSLIRPVIELKPVQPGEGDPHAAGLGKNLCPEWEQGNIGSSSGTDSSNSTVIRSGFVAVVPGTTYTISRSISGGSFAVRAYDADKAFVGLGDVSIAIVSGNTANNPMSSTQKTATFTVLDGTYYLRFIDYTNDLTNKYQLEVGSTATDYEPYENIRPISGRTDVSLTFNGLQTSIALGQTVYGGSLDAESGALTITHGEIVSYSGESLPGAWLSDRDVYAAGAVPTTGAQVAYELAEPVAVQLTPVQTVALDGLNTLATDGDGLTVTYNRSLTHALDEVFARIEALENAVVSE